ncbi:MAG: 50S ribosomal protein L32 [Holosporales bacterium]|nr:50S ribosomal protein L32 [Holosporales bacterium]
MAVPKKRTSSSKQRMRRSHDFIKTANVLLCENCGKPVLSHNICKSCSFYKGRNVRIVEKSTTGV